MNKKSIFKAFTNPYVGPIVFVFIILFILMIFVIPKYTEENLRNSTKEKALSEIKLLKTLRGYYTEHVVKVVKNNSDIKINFNHKNDRETIPLPATLIHDFNEILSNQMKEIKLYSNYPFPNRKDRVLKDYEKEALSYLINNPNEIFTKVINDKDGKNILIATSDIMFDNACVNCHNSRLDTPKNDWKLGDVRGVLHVIVPYESTFLLTEDQSLLLFSILIIGIFILAIHYTILAIQKQKEHHKSKISLEELVKDRTKTLENTNKLLNEYKKAIDQTAIVSKTTPKGIITYVNDKFCEVSGYTKEEAIGKKHNIVRHLDTPKSVFDELWQTIKRKQIWQGQIKNRKKDGGYYYVSTTIVPILNNHNEIDEFIAIRYDITKLVESSVKIEQANKAKTTFLANMSHEIRTPLNAIIGFSQVLASSSELNEKNHKYATVVESSAKSLLSIINDILDISKIESGTFDINYKDSDIFEICEHVHELFANKASKKNINLQLDFDKQIPYLVSVDDIRLRQVISNFVSNAIKFTPEFGKVVIATKLIKKENSKASISFNVKDSGIGIPKDKIENIFQPFIQVDNESNRKYEGTGLGLSICSHIIESFGSKIEVESEVGGGTIFSFILDLEIKDEGKRKLIKDSKIEENSSFKGKLLVAEDNPANQELIKYILDSLGVSYIIASNGQEAVNLYKENHSIIDLILMDINMPILDGINAFKQILDYEKENSLTHTPISALTANAIKGDKEKFLSLGMDYYLSKPIDTNALKEFFLLHLKGDIKVREEEKEASNEEITISKVTASSVASHLGLPEAIGQKLLTKFKADIYKDLEELKSFIEEENHEQIKQKAHYIKNSCLNIALKSAVSLLQSLETNFNDSKQNSLDKFIKLESAVKESL